jgi:YVTN family beta-propeller protein
LPCRPRSGVCQNGYITNSGDGTVSVIDTATNRVIDPPIPVGRSPVGVAVTPNANKVFVANQFDNTMSVM